MIRILIPIILIALVPLSLCGCVVLANRLHVPDENATEIVDGPLVERAAGRQLSVMTWNIGYAGMGQESDFVFDKGTQLRPLSADLVEANLTAIAATLSGSDVDVILLQEVAKPSWNTWQIDVLEGVREALADRADTFGADILTRYVPPPVRVEIGNAAFSRVAVEGAETRGLPLEPTFELGVFRKGYRMHVMRLAGPERWVMINIHLSAFDTAEANVREAQLREVVAFAAREYAVGNRVVIGGDWNLRLVDCEFPHRTTDEFLFWIRDLPSDAVPEGWTLAVDPDTPTVRTANKPYVEGENYRLIVDGFLVSPNIAVRSIRTSDLKFRHTDHHPVMVRLEAATAP